tara:strand:+ start:1546 stop:3120 length:1575 start_codon:yes stop_codon:yes gene_type:complete
MKFNKQLVIIDTEKDLKKKFSDSDIVFWKNNKSVGKDNKEIEISLKGNTFLKNQKYILCKELNIYYNRLQKKFPNKNLHHLEVFNIRNDKIRIYDKIIFFSLIKKLISKKRYKKILIFSDDDSYVDFYRSLCRRNNESLEIIFSNSRRKKINYKFQTFLFILRVLLITIYAKIFFKNKLENSYENCCLSLYPNFYKKRDENFFKQKYLKLNFIISDEVVNNSSFRQKILYIKELQNQRDIIIAEKFILLKDIVSKFFKINNLSKEIRKIDEEKIFFNNLDLSNVINEYTKMSIYNAFKFEIYNNSLLKPFVKYRIKKFHYYMFEYNFGFFLTTYLRKKFREIDLIGYQHGIFSEKVMWMYLFQKNKIKKLLSPNKIIVKYKSSISAYKKFFSSKIQFKKDKSRNNLYFLFKKKKSKKKDILVILGLHDEQQMLDQLQRINYHNKNLKFYLKFHPKSKKKEITKYGEFNVINLKNNIKFDYMILSQTSSLIYNFAKMKDRFYILRINTISNLLPKEIEKKIKYFK